MTKRKNLPLCLLFLIAALTVFSACHILLRGWFRALDYYRNNPQKAAVIMAEREGITPEPFISSLKILTLPDLKANIRSLAGCDKLLYRGVQKLEEIMTRRNLIRGTSGPALLFNEVPLKGLAQ